jgi:hypothetical protein
MPIQQFTFAEHVGSPTPAPTRHAFHLTESMLNNEQVLYAVGNVSVPGPSSCMALWRFNDDGSIMWVNPLCIAGTTNPRGIAVTSDLTGTTAFAAGYLKTPTGGRHQGGHG